MRARDDLAIVIAADPGLPSRRAAAIQDDVRALLADLYQCDVRVSTTTSTLRTLPHGDIDTATASAIADDYERCDAVVVLTEVPRRTRGQPLVAEAFPDESLVVISCPTLGAWATRARIQRVLVDSVTRVVGDPPAGQEPPRRLRWSGWSERASRGSLTLHADTVTGAPRLVMGMVAANEPARTAPRLSGALAAATATGAFGVFYSSIWQMAAALSPQRLAVIAVMAMVAMVAWLMVSNRLWDRRERARLATVILLYNLSTVLTLALVVAALFVVLFVVILGASALVIDPGFMGQVLGEDATVGSYVRLALLAASMGVVAGALGSNFDSDTDLRQLTHGQRERARVRDDAEGAPGT
ncbi:hypothetical protein [Demequina sp. NBRC 110057]|uniref:hypothetical protein n=1 Tax=Demequina sp. NBRC 110057 TaxID=1570346 RepID=UPI00190EC7B7|nr:hypothetical protein [Demequina sp. NBRC 110057]